jgi:hypothetical protein
MALGVPSLVIDHAAPDFAQHLTTDVNNAFNRITAAADAADTALTASIAAVAADVAALPPAVVSGLTFISAATANNSAAIDFTGIDSTYDEYLFTGSNIHPGTDSVDFWIRVSENAGSSFKAGASDYIWQYVTAWDLPNLTFDGASADTRITTTATCSNVAARSLSFEARLFAPSSATAYKLMTFETVQLDTTPNLVRRTGSGAYVGTTNAVNAVRFMFSSGNIASGGFRLYGMRKT